MSKQAWMVAVILSLILALTFVGLVTWHRGLELTEARVALAQAKAQSATNQVQLAAIQSALAEAETRTAELRRLTEDATRGRQTLEDAMRQALQSKDVTISELQGRLTVNILDRVLFDSGEAALKPGGQEVLRQVAAVLAQHASKAVHVIGHTDNVPIRASARSRFASNWELSTARATAAVRFLSEQAGVDPRRLGAVGYGEFRPLADNATPEGRAKNRRIAIVVLADERVGIDIESPEPASPLPASGTNLPPAEPAPAQPEPTDPSAPPSAPQPAAEPLPAEPPR